MKSLSCYLTESPLMKMEMSDTSSSRPRLILGTPFPHFVTPHWFSVHVVFNTENEPLEELGLFEISLY